MRIRNLHSSHWNIKITSFPPCCDLRTSGKTILNKQWSRWPEKGFLLTALQEAAAIAQAMKRSHRFLLNGSCLASQSQTGRLGIRGSPWLQGTKDLPQLLGLPSSQGLLEQEPGPGGAGTPSCTDTGMCQPASIQTALPTKHDEGNCKLNSEVFSNHKSVVCWTTELSLFQ